MWFRIASRSFTAAIIIGSSLLMWTWTGPCYAAQINGRLNLGGFLSTERFSNSANASNTSGNSPSNDFAAVSARSFLRVSQWGDGKWEFTSDIRDKHDLFEKLDAERLHLTAANTLQVRQLSIAKPKWGESWGLIFGRFSLPEAGGVFVDGSQIEKRWTASWRGGVFGGFNPQEYGQTYLHFQSNAHVYGTHLTYDDKSIYGWNKNFYLSHAIINRTYDSHIDRSYIFHELLYQWSTSSRLMTMAYLDFLPRTSLQTAHASWQQELTLNILSELDALSIDVVEYARRQGVLETLPSSAYHEASIRLTYRPSLSQRADLRYIAGKREVDRLQRSEIQLVWSGSGIFSPRWDTSMTLATRRYFTTRDLIARWSLGYFSPSWEVSLQADLSLRRYDSGETLHPLITELNLSHFISRSVFATLSLQRAADERVQIYTAFASIGYRYGNQEISAIRDGAPPRGVL